MAKTRTSRIRVWQAAAKAGLDDLNRGKLTGQIDGPGNPALFAEALVTLSGFDPDADGDFLAKSVTHSFSSGGYTTSATLETKTAESEAVADDSAEG